MITARRHSQGTRMYRLHGFCQSGNTYKVALLLQALKQPWQAVHVDYMNGVTRTGEWRAEANQMGEVPMLDDGDRRLTQSGVILTYLARKHGAYGGRSEDEELEVLRWLLFDNHKFTSYLASYRFMNAFEQGEPDPAVEAWLRGRMDNAFGIVDAHLSNRAFMVGDQPTIADFSLCGYLFFPPEEIGYEVAGRYPYIAAWLERIRGLPGWADPYEILPGERIAPVDRTRQVAHFPAPLRGLPKFDGPFDAHKLSAPGCDVLFASYPAGTCISSHTHETDNVGVITQGELILTMNGKEQRFGVGSWYRVPAAVAHAARFAVATSEIEFWFRD
jgi:glutathione S-transferase